MIMHAFLPSPLVVSPMWLYVPPNQPSVEHQQASSASPLFSTTKDSAITTIHDDFTGELVYGQLDTDPDESAFIRYR